MATLALEESELKNLLKAAFREVLEERRDFLRELLEEALEDLGLARAIDEGEKTPFVERAEVFKLLGEAG